MANHNLSPANSDPHSSREGPGAIKTAPATIHVKVIPHPRFTGFWAILVDGSLYGKFDRRELAVAYAVTRV